MKIRQMLNKVMALINNNIDKICHTVVTALIVDALATFMPLYVAVGLTVAAVAAKEIFDQWRYNGWSFPDLLADIIGLAIGLALIAVRMAIHG